MDERSHDSTSVPAPAVSTAPPGAALNMSIRDHTDGRLQVKAAPNAWTDESVEAGLQP